MAEQFRAVIQACACENYEVERQRHNTQIHYTQDSSFPPIYTCSQWCLSIVKPAKQSEKLSCLFPGVDQFLSKLALHGLEEASQCYESSPSVIHTPREVSDYNSRKCAVTLALLRFVTVLLTRHPKEAFGVRSLYKCINLITCMQNGYM